MDKRDEKDGKLPSWCCNVNQRGRLLQTNATPAEMRFAWSGRRLVDVGRTLRCLINVVARFGVTKLYACKSRHKWLQSRLEERWGVVVLRPPQEVDRPGLKHQQPRERTFFPGICLPTRQWRNHRSSYSR